jgi:hypothetical protein
MLLRKAFRITRFTHISIAVGRVYVRPDFVTVIIKADLEAISAAVVSVPDFLAADSGSTGRISAARIHDAFGSVPVHGMNQRAEQDGPRGDLHSVAMAVMSVISVRAVAVAVPVAGYMVPDMVAIVIAEMVGACIAPVVAGITVPAVAVTGLCGGCQAQQYSG